MRMPHGCKHSVWSRGGRKRSAVVGDAERGMYICAEGGGDREVVANRTAITPDRRSQGHLAIGQVPLQRLQLLERVILEAVSQP